PGCIDLIAVGTERQLNGVLCPWVDATGSRGNRSWSKTGAWRRWTWWRGFRTSGGLRNSLGHNQKAGIKVDFVVGDLWRTEANFIEWKLIPSIGTENGN